MTSQLLLCPSKYRTSQPHSDHSVLGSMLQFGLIPAPSLRSSILSGFWSECVGFYLRLLVLRLEKHEREDLPCSVHDCTSCGS